MTDNFTMCKFMLTDEVIVRAQPLAVMQDERRCLILVHRIPSTWGEKVDVLTYCISVSGVLMTTQPMCLDTIRDYMMEVASAWYEDAESMANTQLEPDNPESLLNEFYIQRRS